MNKYVEWLMVNTVRVWMKKTVEYSSIDKEKGILLICRHPLGDTVNESLLLRGIRQGYPNHHITVVCSNENYNLLERCPYIDELLVYDSKVKKSFLKENLKRTFQFAKSHLLNTSYELAIIPSTGMPAIIEAWLSYFSRAKQRLTYSEKFNPQMHAEYMGAYDRYFTDVLYIMEP